MSFFKKWALNAISRHGSHSLLPLENGGLGLAERPGVILFITMLLSFFLFGNTTAQSSKIINPFLAEPTHLFTAKLNFQQNTFTGYLGVKYEDANNFRISFNSTMGSTLMDLEWKDGVFIKHYLPEQLNRKIIINKLQDDFEMMLLHLLAEGKWKDANTLKVGCHKYRFEENTSLFPTKVEDRNWLGRVKRTLNFGYSEQKKLNTILLKHHSFALQMELSSID